MIELFPNISDEAKKQAELAWTLARSQRNPVNAVNTLNAFTNYYTLVSKEEGIRDFLQFYFNLKMEELKDENNFSER